MLKPLVLKTAVICSLIPPVSTLAYRDCSHLDIIAGADLSHCKFINQDFSELDLSGTDFSHSKLMFVDFGGANLSEADFTEAKLKFVNLTGVQGRQAKFTGATLAASLAGTADFSAGEFSGANIRGSFFKNADLRFSNLSGAKLRFLNTKGVDFLGANFTGTRFKAVYFEETACPTGAVVSYPQDCTNETDVRYVAIGNSLTSGVQNLGLRTDFQDVSFPNLIAKALHVPRFEQPLVDYPGVGIREGKSPLYPDPVTGFPTDSLLTEPPVFLNIALPTPYHNLGVPGATVYDMLYTTDANTQGGYNPLFEAILRPALFGPQTQIESAVELNPTYISLWAGNNDILGGVSIGTIIEGVTVTPPSQFGFMMQAMIQKLLNETDADIILGNIPDITSIPYVTTVPKYVFDPATFQLIPGNIPFVTEEADVEYVLIDALKEIQAGEGIPAALGGSGIPLAAKRTLTTSEVALATNIINAYNSIIQNIVDTEDRVFLADAHQLLSDIRAGEVGQYTANWPVLDPEFSVFSLDGFHLNTTGYKLVSELFKNSILENVRVWE